mgnify:FL=1
MVGGVEIKHLATFEPSAWGLLDEQDIFERSHSNPMKKEPFNELLQGVRELGAALKGDKSVVTRIDRIDPDSVGAVRAKLKLSQSEFARMLGISVDTLQNWEQGRRQPTGAARVPLRVAAKHPEVVLEAVA